MIFILCFSFSVYADGSESYPGNPNTTKNFWCAFVSIKDNKGTYGYSFFDSDVPFNVRLEVGSNINVQKIVSTDSSIEIGKWDYSYQRTRWELGLSSEYFHTDGIRILSSNFDVYTESGDLVYKVPFNWDDGDYFVKFLQPREGFSDNSYLFNFLVHYQVPMLDESDVNDYKVTVTGGIEGYDYGAFNPVISHEFDYIGGMTGQGIFQFARAINEGVDYVTVTVENENLEFSASSTISIERLLGFVDEDGDGLDDRTGRTDNNVDKSKDIDLTTGFNDGYKMPVRSDYDDGFYGDVQYGFAFITWVLTYPFYAIGQVFSFFTKAIKSLFTGFNDFVKPINQFVSWLPNELKALVVAVFTLVIVKFALRR